MSKQQCSVSYISWHIPLVHDIKTKTSEEKIRTSILVHSSTITIVENVSAEVFLYELIPAIAESANPRRFFVSSIPLQFSYEHLSLWQRLDYS